MLLSTSSTPTSSLPAVARKRLEGTPQQERFWSHLLSTDRDILLEARAGTGKSSSCREGMHRLLEAVTAHQVAPAIRYCCFNKKIADEFRIGCPSGAEVGTMHSFGFRELRNTFQSTIAERDQQPKTFKLIDRLYGEKAFTKQLRRVLAEVVSACKNAAITPDLAPMPHEVDIIVENLDIRLPKFTESAMISGIAADILRESAKETKVIDFDDMLWLPVVHRLDFKQIDYLFIDEVQDLNNVQLAMVRLLNIKGVNIFVGDPFQSVYGFRGATDAIDKIRDGFTPDVMPLTVSFRCPQSVVDLARRLVPDFEAAPNAIEGTIQEVRDLTIDRLSLGDFVLCRLNAPIISMCLNMIEAGIPALVRGRDVGERLIDFAYAAGFHGAITRTEFLAAVDRYFEAERSRLDEKDGADAAIESLTDRHSALMAISRSCSSLDAIIPSIRKTFTDNVADPSRVVTFSTIHRAKGSEANRVFLIDAPERKSQRREAAVSLIDQSQERNLCYVALTRARESFTFASSDRSIDQWIGQPS